MPAGSALAVSAAAAAAADALLADMAASHLGAQQLLALAAPHVRSMPTFQFQELPGGMQLWLQASAPAQPPQQAPQPQRQQQPGRLPEASSPGCRRTAVAAAAAPMRIQERAQFLACLAQLRPQLAMQGPQEQQTQHEQQRMLASAGNRAPVQLGRAQPPHEYSLQPVPKAEPQPEVKQEQVEDRGGEPVSMFASPAADRARGALPVPSAGTVAALLASPLILAGLAGGA